MLIIPKLSLLPLLIGSTGMLLMQAETVVQSIAGLAKLPY